MKETIHYRPRGVCSQAMEIDVEDGIVLAFRSTGGCNGNLKGIGRLIQGMKIEDVIGRLEGTTCGPKSTSCPDQITRALKEYLRKKS